MSNDKTVLLKDYTPPPFLVDTVDLDVEFLSGEARVGARMSLRRNPLATDAGAALVLDGDELETLAVSIDGVALAAGRYAETDSQLTIADVPDAFELRTLVRIRPDGNTSLSGLFRSADGYFTQCEAQGFRRITWFQDRPDVMSRYTVTLHADRDTLPFLLANGNPVGQGEEPGGRHWAKWEDPFPKPCYLFAMVAARLDVLRNSYRTTSGRDVQLTIFVSPGKLDQCGHAMEALKKSMKWDEDTFGLECDLDHYMIVAVGDFNMGAMENKGLNIFNTKYVLARADVATDTDFENIDRVVAHEYFHNWTGNRVTCRDWFQLSLKEGLTVFRDQEFGADVHSRSVARIREVRGLRAGQFPEDAGPMAHPVRPSSYVEINNFYTATVYEKGAEVVRMIRTLIGRDAFRRGMDIYFQRHDGQAVTCDDFVAAMAAASGADFGQFMNWYVQAGTPRLAARGQYDAAARRYGLTLTQLPPASQPDNLPYHIPVALGLVGADGKDVPIQLANPDSNHPPLQGEGWGGDGVPMQTTAVLSFTEAEQTFVFENVAGPVVPSLLRDYSAPVLLEFPYTDEDLAHLLAHDSDPFNRWEAGQRLAGRLILAASATIATGGSPAWPESFAAAAARVLDRGMEAPAFAAEALSLPSEATLAEQMDLVDPDAPHAARNGLRRFLAERLGAAFRATYDKLASASPFKPDSLDAGRRALRNVCLGYLGETDSAEGRSLAWHQFEAADNMTDQFAALATLAQGEGPERLHALDAFHERWQQEALVMDKWLAVQSGSRRAGTLAEVMRLSAHPAFDMKNPNKVYALWRGFGANHVRFHAADGSGYRFLADCILRLDAVNPQVTSRLARCFDRWKKFDAARQAHARAALETICAQSALSSDVREVVERALQ